VDEEKDNINFRLRNLGMKMYTDMNISFFHSRTVHFDIIKLLLPTDAQENCFERSNKIYINP
jgi:hypothetical protein